MTAALIIDTQSRELLDLGEVVADCGFSVDTADDLKAARRMIRKRMPDVTLIHIRNGDSKEKIDAVNSFSKSDLGEIMEVFLVTRNPTIETARRGMQIGASDYFKWPDDEDRLRESLGSIREELAEGSVRAEDATAERQRLQGDSPAMRRVFRVIRKVAPTEATVLIAGESGVGKEIVARTIHALSGRSDGPFTALNCGAIVSDLIESELFGHRKGAFTGALNAHKGFFEQSEGGTLFLDEITEMDPELQVKLLRVLETRRVRPIGGEKSKAVDVRLIASTNRVPEEAVTEGVLREDLYYRIAEFPLQVPPLRDRGDDVVVLAKHFLDAINRREDVRKPFSKDALDVLRLHDWPGNVRELKNAVARGYILAVGEIKPEDLPANIPSGGAISGDQLRFPVGSDLKEMERRMILATLEEFDDDKPRTAEALGISLKTLYNRLKTYQSKG